MTELFLIAGVVWVPIALVVILRHGFLILLVWLAIAPLATLVIEGRVNQLFRDRGASSQGAPRGNAATEWADIHQDVRLDEVFRGPTRLVFVLFILAFLLDRLRKQATLSFDRTEIWMVVFCLILLANIFLLSARRPYSLRIAIDSFVVPFAGYYLGRRYVTSRHRFDRLLRVFGYVGVYLITIGLVERAISSGLTYRLHGAFRSGSEYYSVLAVMFFAMLLHCVSNWKNGEKRQLNSGVIWFVLCLSPVIILLTWSRGLWLGFLMSLSVFAVLGFRLIRQFQRVGWLGGGMAALPVVLLALSLSVPETAIETRVLTTSTVEWRYERWLVTVEQGMQNPYFGVGFKNLQDVLLYQIGTGHTAHNFILSIFAELGGAGLFAFLIVTISLILTGVGLYKRGESVQARWRGVVFIAIIIGTLTPSFFANTVEAANVSLIYQYVFLGGMAAFRHPSLARAANLPHASLANRMLPVSRI
jgi:hypothetical protein